MYSLLTTTSSSITTIEGLFEVVTDVLEGIVAQLQILLGAVTSNVFFIVPFAMALVGFSIRFFWKLFGR